MEELSFQEKLSVRLKALDGAFFKKNIYILIFFFSSELVDIIVTIFTKV